MRLPIATVLLFATLALGGCGKGADTAANTTAANTTETTASDTATAGDNLALDNAGDLGGNALDASGGNAAEAGGGTATNGS